jgi:hypothetical protein
MDAFKFVCWLIMFMLAINFGFRMVSASNTIENVIGLFLVVGSFYVTIKTKFFLNININFKKHEK